GGHPQGSPRQRLVVLLRRHAPVHQHELPGPPADEEPQPGRAYRLRHQPPGKLRRSGQRHQRKRPTHPGTHPRTGAPLQRRGDARYPGLLRPGRQLRMAPVPTPGTGLAESSALPVPGPCDTRHTDRELNVNTALTATYALTVLLLIATPGPVVALIVNTAAACGTRKALFTAVGTNWASLVLIGAAAW